MKFKPLSRRTLLKGAAGTAMALPLLDAMLDSPIALAQAQQAKRYVVFFGGFSLGADGDPMHTDLVPSKVGADYELKTATQSFAADGTQKLINICSSLRIPNSSPGGWIKNWHGGNHSPLLSGVSAYGGGDEGSGKLNGESSDQLVAAAFKAAGVNTVFDSLQLRVQAASYSPGPYLGNIMSAKKGADGKLQLLNAEPSPRAVFQKLFSNLSVPSTQAPDSAALKEREVAKSVLDLCAQDRAKLLERLGAADKRRLTDYFDQCRDLEKRLQSFEQDPSSCAKPADPGADPKIGADSNVSLNNGQSYSQDTAYSNEEARAALMTSMVHLAFACDLTRVASILMTYNQSFMNIYAVTGERGDLHGLSHFNAYGTPKTSRMAKAQGWHYKHFSKLVAMLNSTKDASGQTLLANSALAFVNEGGHGPADFGGAAGGAHSAENMVVITAGGAGGLKQGMHFPLAGKHPGQVILTLMNAVGVSSTKFGEVSGALADLRG